jgi:hypothetical protein
MIPLFLLLVDWLVADADEENIGAVVDNSV